jgi:hypothetical protein
LLWLESLGHWGADGGTEAAYEAEWSVLGDLIEAVPTTLAGVIASMRYIVGLGIGDDEIGPLLANLAEALQSLEVQS